MKRLIAILIAILTILFGGVRSAEEQPVTVSKPPVATEAVQAEPEIVETESTVGEPTEKEMSEPVIEAESTEPDVTPLPTEETEKEIELPMPDEHTATEDDPVPGTDEHTPSFQLTEQETVSAEETTVTTEPPVATEQPEVIPPTPIPTTEEPEPKPTEKETEKEDDEPQSNGNAPVFIDPCHGGPNPFDDDTPTEIDDHSSDEFIGEGNDRPGEGIHF